jgi:hypothetical protein
VTVAFSALAAGAIREMHCDLTPGMVTELVHKGQYVAVFFTAEASLHDGPALH